MHIRTITTLAAVTTTTVTTVSALAAAPPHAHQAVAVIGPKVTQPPSLQARHQGHQVHGAFRRAEPQRPRAIHDDLKKRDSDDDDELPDTDDLNDDINDDIDIPEEDDYDDYDYVFPANLPTSLKPLYTTCASAYASLITSAPTPTGAVGDWIASALDDGMAWTTKTTDDYYGNVCGTLATPLTPPASLSSSYAAWTSATSSFLSTIQPQVTSLAKACKPVYYDVVFSLLMTQAQSNWDACTSAWYDYNSLYASLACATNSWDCSRTSDFPPRTTTTGGAGAGVGGGGAAADATTTVDGPPQATGSGAAGAGASSTTASGNAGAPKQTFAAAAVVVGVVAAVAAL